MNKQSIMIVAENLRFNAISRWNTIFGGFTMLCKPVSKKNAKAVFNEKNVRITRL